jgi:hypothetical protein
MHKFTNIFANFRLPVLLLFVVLFSTAARAEWQSVGSAAGAVERRANGVILRTTSGARVLIEFFDLNVVRVRFAPGGTFEKNISYAVGIKNG